MSWAQHIADILNCNTITLDGKTLKGSHDRINGKKPIHMVSAFAVENNLTIGQVKVEEKSNEITAMPKLIKALDIKGSIVTTDAMGCQKEIAKEIIKAKADYILAVKENHPALHTDIKFYFDLHQDLDIAFDQSKTINGDHGRIEERSCSVTSDIDWLVQKESWSKLQSLIMVESRVFENGKERMERRYFLSSLKEKANFFLKKIRSHWRIENSLHWMLDVSFSEDKCRVRRDHGAENFSILRRIGLNLLKRETTSRLGIKSRRLKAGWNNNYLLRVLSCLQR